MNSSFCPKCKKFLTPDIDKCPACGFDRKKYFDKNFYSPNSKRSASPDLYGEGLNIFWKFRIFIFPISYIVILLFGFNKRQRKQGFSIFLVSVILFSTFLSILYLLYFSSSPPV